MIAALLGGVLIGSAALLFFALNGRIAGVSGIIRNFLFGKERLGSMLFLIGVVAGAGIFYALGGSTPVARENFPAWLLALAGVLTGFGTALARGCTSGHGVCGLGRLSPRSLAAVATFIGTAMLTTFVVRHIFGVS
ncbi:MAG: YeeE/YedE family protein [Gallionellaceae bacterium]|jgi:uncharacterized membrane protein YedE/YeeE|nr:YeeE/YedE family protein [Gallionellaceae bacterium]